ncbi:hypothetical protein CLAFUR4_14520 [Fulvia fulva]|nr:hypothetical protein CLAFUR4_14520 [Fulvia fulva]WPV37850.1 hypothetical protein CLAFUW7_14529 [Fulvia fulva]
MASRSVSSLPEVIRHYSEVAEVVNHREMNRFIQDTRSRWDPPTHEKDYRFEGWTSEGALTKCIYQGVFWYHDRPQPVESWNASDAEIDRQIQIRPTLEEIINFVAKPIQRAL